MHCTRIGVSSPRRDLPAEMQRCVGVLLLSTATAVALTAPLPHLVAHAQPVLRSHRLITATAAPEAANIVKPEAKEAPPSENAEIVGLAGPTLVSTLIDPFLSLVDAMWVGRIGSAFALGAVTASSELFTMAFACSLALREASSSSIARLSAGGHTREAAAFARRTLQLGAITGIIIAALLAGPTSSAAVSLMGAHPGSPLYVDALAYARARALFVPCALACSAAEGAFRGYGDTRTPLRAAACAAVANALLCARPGVQPKCPFTALRRSLLFAEPDSYLP